MPVSTAAFSVEMTGDSSIENITARVQAALEASRLQDGIVTIFVRHTTASVMIIEDEPGIRDDTKAFWEELIPADRSWQHNQRNSGEDNGHSHLRGQLQGPSLVVPFSNAALALGTWQQIVVVDFDTRSRRRDLVIQLMGEGPTP